MKSTSSQLKNIKDINKNQDEYITLLTENYDIVNRVNNEQETKFNTLDEKIENVKSEIISQMMPNKAKLIEYFKTMAGFTENIATIYINEGTEEVPAKVHGGETYNILNPFPGKTVTGRAEIYFDNAWIEYADIKLINKSDGTIDVVCPAEFKEGLTEIKARVKLWAVDMASINIAVVDNAVIGEMRFSLSKQVNPGWLPLDGKIYSREQYSALWNWANAQKMVITEEEWQNQYTQNNGNVPKFSSGNESTTFRLPVINAWTKGSGNTEEIGTYVKPGLPNLTGNISAYSGVVTEDASGTFEITEGENSNIAVTTSESAGKVKNIGFKASKMNAIYGNSLEVQPSSVIGMWVIKAYENTVYDANDATLQDLQQVANKSFVGAEVIEGNLVLTTNNGQKVTIEGIKGNGNTLGEETIGAEDTPIYLNKGVPTAGRKLGNMAYENKTDYAAATHGHNNLVSKEGGDLTGPLKITTAKGTTGSDSTTGLVIGIPGVSANTGIYTGNGIEAGQADMLVKAGKSIGFVDGTKNNGITVSIETQTGNINTSTINGGTPLTTNNYSNYAAVKNHTHDYASASHTHDDRYYTETEVNTLLSGKAAASHTHSQYLTAHATVDSALSSTSTNAVQNKVVNAALAGKAASNHTHSQYLTAHATVDSALSSTSTNAVQNKVVNAALAGKAAASHTHSQYLTSHQDISGKANKSGDTFTGHITLSESKSILLRPGNAGYTAGIGYDTAGNECIGIWAKNGVTRLRWHAGVDMSNMSSGTMMGITPDFEISKASGTAKGYIGGTEISVNGHTHSQYLTSHQNISGKANLSGATFTGAISAPTITVTSTLNIPGGKIWIA